MNKKLIAAILAIVILGIIWYVVKPEAKAPTTENMLIDDGTPLENPDADMIDDFEGETGGEFDGIYR